jgi:hypothetical protein
MSHRRPRPADSAARPVLSAAFALTFVMTAVIGAMAAEPDLPARKAGLWDMKLHITGGGVPTMAVQHCTDAATDRDLRTLYSPMAKETCANHDVVRTATGYTAKRVCNRDDGTVTTTDVEISGDFQTAYEARLLTRAPDAAPGDPPASDMTMKAKFLGPCKAGQEAGDIIMAGGIKTNVRDLIRMRQQGAGTSPSN